MPGFFVSNNQIDIDLHNTYEKRCNNEQMYIDGATVKRNTLNKFLNDKVFRNTNLLIIIVDGFILNKEELFLKYNVDNVENLIIRMYENGNETFFNELRGGFSGALFDKKKNKWLIYTDHCGVNPIFYSIGSKCFYAGSQLNYVFDACKIANTQLTFDEMAAYQMLTYGFMINDSTYSKEIKRLRGGTYICVQDGDCEIRQYHKFQKNNDRFIGKSEEFIIEELDKEFRKAITLEYKKDKEYNYKSLTDVSGGLDSRMNMWVAHECLPIHLQLITYCKANYTDEIVAKELAYYWKDELLVKQLDDMSFLYDIDENTDLLSGLSLYSGITGGKRLLDSLNMDEYGLEHTGMIGDVVIGSFLKSENDIGPTGMYSEKLSNRLSKEILQYKKSFDDLELFLIYSRGFQGASNTSLLRKNFTEMVSPFMYPDFLQLCLDIPIEYRCQHKIYKKWIISRYAMAASFKWEKIDAKITENPTKLKIRSLIKKVIRKICKIYKYQYMDKNNMNPLDYWLSENIVMQKFLEEYFKDNLEKFKKNIFIESGSHLIEDMTDLFSQGSVSERAMVLTVLSSERFFEKNDR